MSHQYQDLDEVDRGILHLLQRDARHLTNESLANQLGVSPGTIRNRINNLEDAGIIRSYHLEVDYEAAGFPLHILFLCTAPYQQEERQQEEQLISQLSEIEGVVGIRELLTDIGNFHIETVATGTDDVIRLVSDLKKLNLDIIGSSLMKEQRMQSFDHFHLTSESMLEE